MKEIKFDNDAVNCLGFSVAKHTYKAEVERLKRALKEAEKALRKQCFKLCIYCKHKETEAGKGLCEGCFDLCWCNFEFPDGEE